MHQPPTHPCSAVHLWTQWMWKTPSLFSLEILVSRLLDSLKAVWFVGNDTLWPISNLGAIIYCCRICTLFWFMGVHSNVTSKSKHVIKYVFTVNMNLCTSILLPTTKHTLSNIYASHLPAVWLHIGLGNTLWSEKNLFFWLHNFKSPLRLYFWRFSKCAFDICILNVGEVKS